jgi:chorismate mutase
MLDDLRERIDSIDDELVRLIAERFSIAEEMALVKKESGLPILNTAREREIISRLTQGQTDTMAGYIKILYTTLFDLSRSHQTNVLHTASDEEFMTIECDSGE